MRVSEPTKNFAKHIHELHAEIRQKISLSNEEYKLAADVKLGKNIIFLKNDKNNKIAKSAQEAWKIL